MFDYQHVFGERGHLYNQASREFPDARDNERALLIERLDLQPGITVCDAPAGGGYVADGIAAHQAGRDIKIICVEPAERFAAGIDPRFRSIVAPLDQIPLDNGSVERVSSLAGLHHLPSKSAFYLQAHRILAPGGRFVVADVLDGSPQAKFLNGPCDEFSETGHDGQFVLAGELTHDLTAAGFHDVAEKYCEFTWEFSDQTAMTRFCKGLFGLVKADESEVLEAIRRHLRFEVGNGARLTWGLVYATGSRS